MQENNKMAPRGRGASTAPLEPGASGRAEWKGRSGSRVLGVAGFRLFGRRRGQAQGAVTGSPVTRPQAGIQDTHWASRRLFFFYFAFSVLSFSSGRSRPPWGAIRSGRGQSWTGEMRIADPAGTCRVRDGSRWEAAITPPYHPRALRDLSVIGAACVAESKRVCFVKSLFLYVLKCREIRQNCLALSTCNENLKPPLLTQIL